MTNEGQVTSFLAGWRGRRSMRLGYPYGLYGLSGTAQELARDLLADAEFGELRLANWLGTPDGRLIEAAVVALLPEPGQAEAQVLIEALSLAARAKQQGDPHMATAWTLLAVSVLFGTALAVRGRRPH